MVKLIFLVTFSVGGYWLWQTWKRSGAEQRRQLYFKMAFGFFIALLVVLVVTGRIHVLVAAIAAMVPYIRRLLPLLQNIPAFKRFWEKRHLYAGGVAETELISVVREPISGKLTGTILVGASAGKSLDELDRVALVALYEGARKTSPDSILLLQAYFEQRFGQGWRKQLGMVDEDQTAAGGMSIKEAYEILGLPEGASLQDVLEAHRRLIQKMHPDRGGSNFLAAQINRAKDVLTAHLT